MLSAMIARRQVKIGLSALLVVVLALALAQLLLPRIAAKIVKDKVSRYGEVREVSVSAFPAVTLLFGDAESVSVRAGTLNVSERGLVKLLLEAKGAKRLDVHASAVRLDGLPFGASPLLLRDASLTKDGEIVRAHALLTSQALAQALPPGISAEILSSAGGVVSVRASGGILGFRASVNGAVEAVEGKLELVPSGPLLASLGTITLFDQRQLKVLSIGATPSNAGAGGAQEGAAGGSEQGWELSIEAKLA
jgi:hypothetical protein